MQGQINTLKNLGKIDDIENLIKNLPDFNTPDITHSRDVAISWLKCGHSLKLDDVSNFKPEHFFIKKRDIPKIGNVYVKTFSKSPSQYYFIHDNTVQKVVEKREKIFGMSFSDVKSIKRKSKLAVDVLERLNLSFGVVELSYNKMSGKDFVESVTSCEDFGDDFIECMKNLLKVGQPKQKKTLYKILQHSDQLGVFEGVIHNKPMAKPVDLQEDLGMWIVDEDGLDGNF